MKNLTALILAAIQLACLPILCPAAVPYNDDNPSSVNCLCLQPTPQLIRVDVQIDSLTALRNIDQASNHDLLYIDGEGMIEMQDRPVVPFIARSILIPPTGDVDLIIENVEFETVHDLQIVNADIREDEIYPDFDFEVVDNGFFPPAPVVVGEIAHLRDYRILNFHVYPVQVNSETGETRLNQRISFDFEFENGINLDYAYQQTRRPSLYAWRAVRNLVENPPLAPSRDDLQSASYLYIVPNYDGIDDSLEPLIEWRKRQGHKVVVEHVPNNARANEIAGVIDEAYENDNPVEFVALVGDAARADFNISAASNTGDYGYSTIGNDPLPDVALGRISASNLNELDRIVNKLVSYEADPYMADTDWYKQGAVVAGHVGNGLSTILVAKYVRRELLNLGFTEIRSWLHNEDGEIRGDQPFVTEVFDWGISVLHYRAYQFMNRLPLGVIQDLPNRRGRWPAVLAVSCDTGDFTNTDGHTENFLRARGGGIGAIGTATPGTAPQYNNMMAGGVWKGIYKDGLHAFGWGLNTGKYELWRAYGGLDGRYMNFMDWNNLMGDPGTHIWTDIPMEVEVDHTEFLALGDSEFYMLVYDMENEEGVPDAQVCLFKEDELHIVHYTNEEGVLELPIDPENITEGQILLTVTKHNMHPYLAEIEVGQDDDHLGVAGYVVDDDDNGESNGNGNGDLNPGEIVELEVEIHNFGQEVPEGPYTCEVQSASEYLTVIEGDFEFDEVPEPGQSMFIYPVIEIDTNCPDNVQTVLRANVRADRSIYRSLITPDVKAPHLHISQTHLEGGDIEPGDTEDINFSLFNDGHFVLESTTVTLVSEDDVVVVRTAESDYAGIEVDEAGRADQPFSISVNPLAIPGMKANLKLFIEAEGGFFDSLATQITLGEPGNTDPIGPDEYGYICFDSGDQDWELVPEYDWIEINPQIQDHQFEGQALDLNDERDNQDEAVAVNLPFNFQYYGEMFDEITICTNGWAAFGDQSELLDFRNRRIGQALGPEAQLCVWWDNLITVNESAILTYHDEETGKFIIEWSNMRRLINYADRGAVETFQIILFDPELNPTFTGDGMILFQYKEVTNENRQARNDTPFCTIGISNLDDSGGLEYTYYNQYPPGANEIHNEMALLFTTATSFITGTVRGRVYDAEGDDAIEGAIVRASRGFSTITDENGEYYFDLLVGEDYEITASAEDFNDSTLFGFDIAEDETLTVDFGLLYSTFAVSSDQIEARVAENTTTDVQITVSNDGNGPLNWSAQRVFEEGESGLGRRIRDLVIAPEVNDLYLEGVVYVDGRFYVSGQNGQQPNMIYVFDEDGNSVDQFEQVGNSRIGFLDLAYGNGLIWGSNEREIYGFDTEGELQEVVMGPYANNKSLAWDSDREALWTHFENEAVQLINLDGEWLTAHAVPWPRVTGIAYYADDPDDYCLWLLEDRRNDLLVLHKMNTETGDTAFVGELETGEIQQGGGAFLAENYGQWGTVFMVLINDYLNRRGDRIDIWQIGTYKGWMTLDSEEGVIETMQQQDITITLSGIGMFPYTYLGELTFEHSGRGDAVTIPVSMTVYDPNNIRTDEQSSPDRFEILSTYPNPFNSETVIRFNLPGQGDTFLAVYDIVGREVYRNNLSNMQKGIHTLPLGNSDWSAGMYVIQVGFKNEIQRQKLLLLK